MIDLERIASVCVHIEDTANTLYFLQRALEVAVRNNMHEEQERLTEKVQATWDAVTELEAQAVRTERSSSLAAGGGGDGSGSVRDLTLAAEANQR